MSKKKNFSVLATFALASLLCACAAAEFSVQTDARAGHFGAGMHAGRTSGH